jgi:hypothetical protein
MCSRGKASYQQIGLNRETPSVGYEQSRFGREPGPDGLRALEQMKYLAIGEL